MGLWEKGMELLYPSNIYCMYCGSIIDSSRPYALCDHCAKAFHWTEGKTCEKCGKILSADYRHSLCYDCRELDHAFDKGYTCVQYGLYERALLMDYKYNGKGYIGRKLGDILYDRMMQEEEEPDFIVPVPMHRKKEQKRGYNQAAVMARQLAGRWGIPYVPKLLERVKKTAPMRGLGAFERYDNLRGAIAVSEKWADRILGKRFLLVDDIYTTGSTMDACSEALREKGADRICVLSFACGANIPPKKEFE